MKRSHVFSDKCILSTGPFLNGLASSALNNAIEDKSRVFEFYNKNFNNLSIYKYEMQNKLKSALKQKKF